MGYKSLLRFFAVTLTGLTLFIVVGSSHPWISSHSTGHKGASECQTMCPPLLSEKQKTPQFEDDEADPDPLPLQLTVPASYLETLYVVLFSVLVWQFLQRRPPDIVKLQSAYLF